MPKHSSASRRSLTFTALPWLGAFFVFAGFAGFAGSMFGSPDGARSRAGTSDVRRPRLLRPWRRPAPAAAAPASAPAVDPPGPPPASQASSDLPPGGAAAVGDVSPEAAIPEEDEQTKTWRARDSQVDESATLSGGVGLVHLQHAQSLAPGQFNLAFVTEYYAGNFLCTSSFPCPSRTGGDRRSRAIR